MGINIAVEGMILITNPPNVVATIDINSLPSIRLKADGKKVFLDGTQITVTAISIPPAPAVDPGPHMVTLNATGQRVKTGGILPLREGDESSSIIPDFPNPSPLPDTLPGPPFTIKILSAGQTRAKAA